MRIEPIDRGLIVIVDDEQETDRVGRALADLVEPGTVIGLVGPLGAGKTRLVRALAESLNVDPRAIASPTYVLIHEYAGRLPVFHFDTYRLEGPDDFDALGAADYWSAGGVCLVEWADRVSDHLPLGTWTLTIEPTGSTGRRFRVEFPVEDDRAGRLASLLKGEAG